MKLLLVTILKLRQNLSECREKWIGTDVTMMSSQETAGMQRISFHNLVHLLTYVVKADMHRYRNG